MVRALDSPLDDCEFAIPGRRDYFTGMGDRLRPGKPPQYFAKPLWPTQHPTLSGTGNEYRLLTKCGDALRLRSKGRHDSFQSWINVGETCVKLCDPSLTRAIPESFRDEQLIIKRHTNKASFCIYSSEILRELSASNA